MTCEEHYFENLLFRGRDIKGEPNKKFLSKEVQKAIETCANYVLYTLYLNREDFLCHALISPCTEGENNANNKQNEEVSVRPVPGSDMVASESVENANESSSGDIQKNEYKNNEGIFKAC